MSQYEREIELYDYIEVLLSWLERLVVVQGVAGSSPVIHPIFCGLSRLIRERPYVYGFGDLYEPIRA